MPLYIPIYVFLTALRNGSKAASRVRLGWRRYTTLARAAARAPSPFATHKTAVVLRSRSQLTSGRANPAADALRLSAVTDDGTELAVSWIDLPDQPAVMDVT